MERDDVQRRLDAALGRLVREDKYLFENNLGERCIAARLAMDLQAEFPEHNIDAEYNRDGAVPKHLGLNDDCANYREEHGQMLVVPDVIVHRRGRNGPNVLVIEVKRPPIRLRVIATGHAFAPSVRNTSTNLARSSSARRARAMGTGRARRGIYRTSALTWRRRISMRDMAARMMINLKSKSSQHEQG